MTHQRHSPTIWLYGDLHLGHTKAAAWRKFSSTDAHDRPIETTWRALIHKRDTIYILGDAAFGHEAVECLGTFPGLKRLILGNHDNYRPEFYLENRIKPMAMQVIHDVLLTHIPINPFSVTRWIGNIHAHTHHNTLRDPRYLCVSADQTNLEPITLNDAISTLKTQQSLP